MSRRLLLLPSWAALACLGFVLSGCGEKMQPPAEQVATQPTSQPAAQPKANNQKGTPPTQKKDDAPPPVVDPEAGYPAQLADWTDENFREARKINHSRLVLAIHERAKESADDSDDARFWGELLEIKPPSQGRDADFAQLAILLANGEDIAAVEADDTAAKADDKEEVQAAGLGANVPPKPAAPSAASAGGGGGAPKAGGLGNIGGGNSTANSNVDESKMGKGSAQEIVKVLIDAEVANKTDDSTKPLTAILSGEVDNGTPDEAMLTFALEGLKKSTRQEHQDLLFEVLLKPGEFRKEASEEGEDMLTALQLQEKVFSLLEGANQAALKKALAENIGDATPADAANRILDTLLEDNFDNLEAQVILYTKGEVNDEQRAAELRDLLASYSKSAFDRLMGLTEAPKAGATPQANNQGGLGGGNGGLQGADGASNDTAAVTLDGGGPVGGRGIGAAAARRRNPGLRTIPLSDEEVKVVSGALWTKEFEDAMLKKLEDAGTVDGAGDTLNLAGVLPMQGVRRKLAQMVKDHWSDGVSSLAERGVFTSILYDPGMLLVSKSAPMDFPDRFDPNGTPPTGGSRRDQWETNKLKYDWFHSIYEHADTITKRYAAAPGAKTSLGSITPPVPLHAGADRGIEAAFEANWPEDISRKAGGSELDPLKVQYIRVQTSDALIRVKSHYNLKFREDKSYPLESDGLWLTKSETDLEKGVTRSIDIFIKPGTGGGNAGGGGATLPGGPGAAGGGAGGANSGVIVEILTIETPSIIE